jgi:hypothetical protein
MGRIGFVGAARPAAWVRRQDRQQRLRLRLLDVHAQRLRPERVLRLDPYPLTVTAQRSGSTSASTTTVYKVYSADTTTPTLFWASPGNGTTISGHSYNVTVSSSDDHAVEKIDLYIDGAYVSTQNCNDITYTCQLNYGWSPRTGQHTATFKSYDWMGNVGTVTVSFTVS